MAGRILTDPQPGPPFNYPANEVKPGTIRTSREERAAIVDRFGAKLIDVFGENNQNIFLSPLSIHEALTLAASGSAKTTLDAFVRVLDLPKEKSPLNFQAFLTAGHQRENTIQVFKVSNSLWLNTKVSIYKDFIDHSRLAFKAETEQIDFDNKDSVKKINEWISDNTQGKITQVVKELKPDDRLILINTIYFNQNWGDKFQLTDTIDDQFTKTDKSKVPCKLMHGIKLYGFAERDDALFVSIKFVLAANQFLIILPKQEGEAALVNTAKKYLTPDAFIPLTTEVQKKKNLDLLVPRFKAKFSSSVKDALIKLGLGEAFTPQADFSLITPEKVAISDVIHEAVLDVNEDGVEAAATTSVGFAATGFQLAPPDPPLPVKIDRPFIVAIFEQNQGLAAFVGIIRTVE